MSAAELRQAAATLRQRANAAELASPWWETDDLENVCGGGVPEGEAAYIALMHPIIGLELAGWLDQCAERLEKGHHTGSRHSHRIARVINGRTA